MKRPAARARGDHASLPARRQSVIRQTLVYELLDAHADTADLASELQSDPRWAAHLDYLRALQRAGRRELARMSLRDQA